MDSDEVYLVSTRELAKLFSLSDRRILQLLDAGVIEEVPHPGRAKTFDLETVVPQYCGFLLSQAAGGPSSEEWAANSF